MSLLFSDDLCSAFVAATVRSFQKQFPSRYLGRTALQKLIYFSKAIGVPVPCSFEIYNFGPYSEEVTKSVNRLLVDDAIQDDSSQPRYSSYKLSSNADDFSQPFIDFTTRYSSELDAVVGALGKASPSDLELVATLHFVNERIKGLAGTKPVRKNVEGEFRAIKGDKFKDHEIDWAYKWLETVSLI